MDARRAAELAARNSYGRLVAYLAVRSQDISAAEDALGDAFLKALSTWPDKGVPHNPEAWLLVTAKRRLIDIARRSQTYTKLLKTFNLSGLERLSSPEEILFPDERLKLLFICAHPAINVAIRTPLMLQTIMGLNATQIGSAFLVAPTTMGQRLVRAKAKIRDAGIPFTLPNLQELPERLEAVLDAIYAAYSTGWDTVTGGDPRHKGLADEAIWLVQLCVQLMPEEPEVRGLLALMLYCASRRKARRSPSGNYVPLSEQDMSLWSQQMIQQAEYELHQASTYGKLGRFQLEAAIQSVHAQRAVTQRTDWEALAQLYAGLI
ncbi:MAG: RNA polymerase subunit sigma-70, partial [Leptolyngbya sp. SIO3F4]|nr:RNA polymerase subunit sigma-70 [Leptolyngbya sp. SIO3F4]